MHCGAKLIAAAVSQAFLQYVARTVCGQQRGFIPGRSILNIVVELEGGMLQHNMAVETLPGGLLLDFASAFPSLAHEWIFSTLRSLDIPTAPCIRTSPLPFWFAVRLSTHCRSQAV